MTEGLAAAKTAKTEISRTRGAERMQRCRQRRRKGLRCYILELRNEEIDALVQLRFLSSVETNNRTAVIKAMYAFLDFTLGDPA